jgi:metal-sulfur cluster biosynthetic enzyme
MHEEVQKRIDKVLDTVKEPQSLLSLSELNLIEKVHYSETEKKLICIMAIGSPRFQCPACSAINGVVKQGLVRSLEEAFAKEFPGWGIEVS